MSTPDSAPFKVLKVEEFFEGYQGWHTLGKMEFVQFDSQKKVLELKSKNADDEDCALLIYFPRMDSFRVRFNPGKADLNAYPVENNRTIVWDTMDKLTQTLEKYLFQFETECQQEADKVTITTLMVSGGTKKPFMKVVAHLDPYHLSVYRFDKNHPDVCYEVHADENPSIYYKKRVIKELDNAVKYSIIQVKDKRPTAKFSGFGEQGFTSLCKNGEQLNYFNYDNMRYMQFYGKSPLPDNREPLYHADPFFMCFYGNPYQENVYGIYVDNVSQTFMDMGYLNSGKYMFGSLFNDLDYYFYLGDNARDVLSAHTSFVGMTRLKPRWSLGYHQGCYGYDTRGALEFVIQKYRDYQIPIDGLHVDVDLQDDYRTFTINSRDNAFPDPEGMFSGLAANGIKCSTNITPIISNNKINNPSVIPYFTHEDGVSHKYLLVDERACLKPGDYDLYVYYEGGQYCTYEGENCHYFGPDLNGETNFYEGQVFYGNEGGRDLGTLGNYPDLYDHEARKWWGKQYAYLYAMGLEMVWQDMTTPCIKFDRGDMKSFPFKLLVQNDFVRKDENEAYDYEKVPVLSVWNLYSYNLHKATYHGLNHLHEWDEPELQEKFQQYLGVDIKKNLQEKRTLKRTINGQEMTLHKRNFIVGRGGFTGMHRFAALWTGDNVSSWDFYRFNLPQVLALGIAGQSMSAGDVGGFEPDSDSEKWADPELMIRWVGCGAFLPWFRNHYNKKMDKKYFQEIYEYEWALSNENSRYIAGDQRYLYESVVPACKYAINLRYSLMPLFYDCMYENTLDGMPISRAMFLNVEDGALFNEKIDYLNSQFFVGDDLLIAPIMNKGQTHRDIYLPDKKECWYHFKNNLSPLESKVEGGTTVYGFDASIHADDPAHIPSILPVYVRAGAIIPTVGIEQWVGERNAKGEANPVTINIYPGERRGRGKQSVVNSIVEKLCDGKQLSERGGYTMYQDDGLSRESVSVLFKKLGVEPLAEGRYRTVDIDHAFDPDVPGKRRIAMEFDKYRLDAEDKGYKPELETFFFVAILHDPAEKAGDHGPLENILLNGTSLPLITEGDTGQRADQLWNSGEDSWYYNDSLRISYIKIFDNKNDIQIETNYHK